MLNEDKDFASREVHPDSLAAISKKLKESKKKQEKQLLDFYKHHKTNNGVFNVQHESMITDSFIIPLDLILEGIMDVEAFVSGDKWKELENIYNEHAGNFNKFKEEHAEHFKDLIPDEEFSDTLDNPTPENIRKWNSLPTGMDIIIRFYEVSGQPIFAKFYEKIKSLIPDPRIAATELNRFAFIDDIDVNFITNGTDEHIVVVVISHCSNSAFKCDLPF